MSAPSVARKGFFLVGGKMIRLIVDAIVTIASIYVALKLEWPAYLLVVPAYVLAMNFRIISWGQKPGLSRRVEWVLGGFVILALIFGHAFYMTIPEIFGGSPETPATPLYTAVFEPDRVRVFWSFLGGSAMAAVCMAMLLVAIALAAGFAMYHTTPQYRGHEAEAARSGLNLALGIDNGYVYIDNAKIEQIREPQGLLARYGGPGRLLVRLGYAVVLEKDGHPSRVVGSGLTFLQPFERVSMIVPLYGRRETIIVEDVETKDRALIEQIEFAVYHGADPGPREHQIHDGTMVYNRFVILNRIWNSSGSDWAGIVSSVSQTTARDLIGRHKLEDIIPMADTRRQEFRQALKDGINKVTMRLGVQVSVVEIGRIKLPVAIRQEMLDRWMADWESRAKITRAQTTNTIQMTEAKARVQSIIAVAQGLRSTLGASATPKDIIALRYIEYLEQRATGAPTASDKQEVDTLMQLQALGTLNEL